jgi:hypothetical protein
MDIDIDIGNRDKLLALIKHVPAAINRDGKWIKHNTGVYVTDIPIDPINNMASIDYQIAEDLGYVKLDVLNQSVYEQVKSNEHLDQLMSIEPRWDMLDYREFVAQVIHINNHYDTLKKMPEPVNSIPRLMMFLAIIRPAKRHLIGQDWKKVAETIWDKPEDGSYAFKKSHACAYAHLVKIHMNLLCGSA